MWSGHGNRHLVVGEDEPAMGSWIHVGAMDDAGSQRTRSKRLPNAVASCLVTGPRDCPQPRFRWSGACSVKIPLSQDGARPKGFEPLTF